jgi:hypothetical protein
VWSCGWDKEREKWIQNVVSKTLGSSSRKKPKQGSKTISREILGTKIVARRTEIAKNLPSGCFMAWCGIFWFCYHMFIRHYLKHGI